MAKQMNKQTEKMGCKLLNEKYRVIKEILKQLPRTTTNISKKKSNKEKEQLSVYMKGVTKKRKRNNAKLMTMCIVPKSRVPVDKSILRICLLKIKEEKSKKARCEKKGYSYIGDINVIKKIRY